MNTRDRKSFSKKRFDKKDSESSFKKPLRKSFQVNLTDEYKR